MMVYPRFTYKFQFNNDEASCVALGAMIKGDWTIKDCVIEDGYIWFNLIYEK